jgi:hypothetical protein
MKIITEQQIGLIGRRLNAKRELKEMQKLYSEAVEGNVKVTNEQAQKGYSWLLDQYKTPRGVERKNNPFGLREMNILDTGLGYFTYDGHYDAGNMNFSFYLPIYTFYDKEGFSFQYYVSGGKINIIG